MGEEEFARKSIDTNCVEDNQPNLATYPAHRISLSLIIQVSCISAITYSLVSIISLVNTSDRQQVCASENETQHW